MNAKLNIMAKDKNIIDSDETFLVEDILTVVVNVVSNDTYEVVSRFGKHGKGDKVIETRKGVAETLVKTGYLKPIK